MINGPMFIEAFRDELFPNDDERTHDQLRAIEMERRALLNAGKTYSRLQLITAITGTIIPHLICTWQSWSTCLLYAAIRVLMFYKIIIQGPDMPQINTTIISVIGSFMSFFLVFFLSQTYSRFMQQFDYSMRIKGRIFNLCYIARNSLPPAETWRLIRYANAVHVLGYVGLSSAYTEKNLFIPLNDKHKLLTDSEIARLRKIGLKGGAAHREIVGWSIDLLYECYRRGKLHTQQQQQQQLHELGESLPTTNLTASYASVSGDMDINTLRFMLDEVLLLRACMSALYDYSEQSFPFSYLHLTVVISSFYLVIITYTIATFLAVSNQSIFPDVLGGALVILNIFFVVGIREIGRQMIDPYGHDLQDISVIHYLEFTITNARMLLSGHRFQSPGMEVEEMFETCRPSRGEAFSEEPMKYTLNQFIPMEDDEVTVSTTNALVNHESLKEPPKGGKGAEGLETSPHKKQKKPHKGGKGTDDKLASKSKGLRHEVERRPHEERPLKGKGTVRRDAEEDDEENDSDGVHHEGVEFELADIYAEKEDRDKLL